MRSLLPRRGAGRGFRPRAGAARPSAEINVTPLVDVVLVLLIIFMVVTPLLDKRLRVRVPDAEEPAASPAAAAQLVVGIARSGALLVAGEPVEDGAYVDRLRRALRARAPGERVVFFAADDEAPYQRLVTALAGGRRAGAETLALATEPVAVPEPAAPAR